MKHLLLMLLTVLTGCAQQPPPAASSSGKCSPNIIDNKGKVQFTCNVKIDKGTADKMTSLLNEVLDKNADETNRKLDSILEFLQANVNPNRPVVTYDCVGTRIAKGPSESAQFEISDDPAAIEEWKKMATLANANQHKELLDLCSREMKERPEWLTPYLFCSIANVSLKNTAEAKRLLRYYDEHTGPSYERDQNCRGAAASLHKLLQP